MPRHPQLPLMVYVNPDENTARLTPADGFLPAPDAGEWTVALELHCFHSRPEAEGFVRGVEAAGDENRHSTVIGEGAGVVGVLLAIDDTASVYSTVRVVDHRRTRG